MNDVADGHIDTTDDFRFWRGCIYAAPFVLAFWALVAVLLLVAANVIMEMM
jgi:hypothetical protein